MGSGWFSRIGIGVLELLGNDVSRSPVPKPNEPVDYTEKLNRLDPSKPIGVYIFTVDHKSPGWSDATVNVSRNNYIDEMREHYGENFIVVDNPAGFTHELHPAAQVHLHDFVKQFNEALGDKRPVVHIVANHHQNQYDDSTLAQELIGLQGSNKRALILSCGPESKAYEKMPGFDYVIIPRPDGQFLGPELDYKGTPAYRYVFGWMRNEPNADAIKARFASWTDFDHLGSEARDRAVQAVVWAAGYTQELKYLPPVVHDSVQLNGQSVFSPGEMQPTQGLPAKKDSSLAEQGR